MICDMSFKEFLCLFTTFAALSSGFGPNPGIIPNPGSHPDAYSLKGAFRPFRPKPATGNIPGNRQSLVTVTLQDQVANKIIKKGGPICFTNWKCFEHFMVDFEKHFLSIL